MDWLAQLYAGQPFWVWLAIAVVILAVETAAQTEWLLWPAVSAGIVAVATAIGMDIGLPGELILFALLTVASTVLARRFIQKINPSDVDINDRNARLIGQRAKVVEAFVDGRGRVFVSGAEWSAEIEGAGPPVGDSVIVDGALGSRLKVRAV
jgi:membrane protein implicated in regulation of membrane protease activity